MFINSDPKRFLIQIMWINLTQCANISSNVYNMLLLPLLLLLLVQILVLVSVKPADFSALNQVVPGLQSTTTEGWTLWT